MNQVYLSVTNDVGTGGGGHTTDISAPYCYWSEYAVADYWHVVREPNNLVDIISHR